MSTSPQRVACPLEPSADTIIAAGTVFAMLDLLAETDCSEATRTGISLARRGAEARLGELRVSARPSRVRASQKTPLGSAERPLRPPPGRARHSNVIPLPVKRAPREA
jgi:hypothetical protein